MLLLLAHALAAEPPVDWIADEAVYHLRVRELRVEMLAEYHFRAVGGGFATRTLVGPALLVTEPPDGVRALPEGLVVQLGPRSDGDVSFRGSLDAPSASVSLPVLPATRQRVEIDAPGLDVEVRGAVGGVLAATDRLELRWGPHHERSAPPPLVLAEVGTAAWGQDGALAVHAVVRWNVVRGAVESLRMDVRGLDEIELSGAGVGRWERVGDEVIVTPSAPVRGRLTVDLQARAPLPRDTPMPAPSPHATRVERWWVMGRCDEGELMPGSGPETVSRRMVPPWARALSETQPLAFWRGASPVTLSFAKYDAVAVPDTVIPRARIEAVTNEDGRIFLRTTLRVRNERRQYLHVTPPPGFRPFGARVSGQPVVVLDDGAGGLYVPLEKSVESVRGLVTFPVELLWAGEAGAYERKGERVFTVPAVDAPIQLVEWELHLPRGFTSKDPAPAAVTTLLPLDSVTNAMNAYKQNRFDEAQVWLDHARAEGGDGDEDVQALQSNLDVLNKRDVQEDSTTRRVRDLAKAKDADLETRQAEAEKEAERALRSGDLEKAEELYAFVDESADKLSLTEQKESAEQAQKKTEAKSKRKAIAQQREQAAASSNSFREVPADTGELAGADVAGPVGFGAGATAVPEPMPVTEVPPPEISAADEEEIVLGGTIEIDERKPAPAPVSQAAPRPAQAHGGKSGVSAPAAKTAPAEPAKPVVANIPQPPRDLSAHAAPMTLALPLDGRAVAGESRLLEAGQFPTLTVHYRGPR